jgi:stage III sporulation protein SpoIIIAA
MAEGREGGNEALLLLDTLPPDLREAVPLQDGALDSLLELVLDLGRRPEARYPDSAEYLSEREVTREDLDYVTNRVGAFGEDNRAGIPRTLHRISAMRNRSGAVVGLTCRVGRAISGTITIIRDLLESGKSVLILGRPGVGKTTLLREAARVLAEELRKRVVIVDTSNEIAGDGDIPHPAIGRARRMQVPRPAEQHAVMIEAVENHMPEVIVIDEIGTELEALAARTIAERGVQLIGTAHGRTLENLMSNPTLSDLIGGIQAVTLGDEEARRRGTQKTVLERKAPPTFDILVEIQSWDEMAVYGDVAAAVDAMLRGEAPQAEARTKNADGQIRVSEVQTAAPAGPALQRRALPAQGVQRIFPVGIRSDRLEEAIEKIGVMAMVERELSQATLVMTLRQYYQRDVPWVRRAEARGVPVYVLRAGSSAHIERQLRSIFNREAETEELLDEHDDDGAADEPSAREPGEITRLQRRMSERYRR